ncbi:MAG: acyl-CoA dehydrogenase family protein [Gammaproteobacteria bacterium]
MDFELTPDQRQLVDSIAHLVDRHRELPRFGATVNPSFNHYDTKLERDLVDGDYFSIARAEGCGPLEAALLVLEVARSPGVVETAVSALVAPQLLAEDLPRPIAVARAADLQRPIRFLGQARTLLIVDGADVAVLPVDPAAVADSDAMYAYPFAHFLQPPDRSRARRLPGAGAKLECLWRVALAAEAAGAIQHGLDFTVDYVKQRRMFGTVLGAYQAVQHRLAIISHQAQCLRWLALKAAWSGAEADAAIAALYAQEAMPTVIYDLHQFNGGLGWTLEHGLHFWTYRLRALQGEIGGPPAQARATVAAVWG